MFNLATRQYYVFVVRSSSFENRRVFLCLLFSSLVFVSQFLCGTDFDNFALTTSRTLLVSEVKKEIKVTRSLSKYQEENWMNKAATELNIYKSLAQGQMEVN